jgi:hypothetical protein
MDIPKDDEESDFPALSTDPSEALYIVRVSALRSNLATWLGWRGLTVLLSTVQSEHVQVPCGKQRAWMWLLHVGVIHLVSAWQLLHSLQSMLWVVLGGVYTPVSEYRASMVFAWFCSVSSVVAPCKCVSSVCMEHVSCMRPTCRVCLPKGVALTHVQETGCKASANSTVWLSPLKYGVPLVEVTWLGRETARLRFLPDMAGVDRLLRFLPDLAASVVVCRVWID